MASLLLIGCVLLLAAIVPGPDFVLVAKNSTLHSRRAGICTALGIAAGVLCHATYSLAGLGFVIDHSPIIFSLTKWAGALYLFYLGIQLILAPRLTRQVAMRAAHSQKVLSDAQAFVQGFGTNVLNPKAIYFFVGIFSQVVRVGSPLTLKILYILEAGLVVGGWFLAVAWLLNVPGFRRTLRVASRPVEKTMGALLLVFAAKFAFEGN